MNISKLARMDLNLLVALQVLLEERSVSKAASRMAITQPAMSKTLARLREAFNDPLFVRSKRGIQPTPRAESLVSELENILGSIENLLIEGEFSPLSYQGEVSIAISEYVGLSLLPALASKLQTIAPKLRVKTITRVEGQLEQLASGELDFAIQIERASYGPEYRMQPLGSSPLAIFVRRQHPLVDQGISIETLLQYPTINLYISDRENLELTIQNRYREVFGSAGMVETSHLLTALEILRETDYTLLCPAYLARNDGATRDVVALSLPPEHATIIDYALVAHERTQRSP
ncbi:MAG: LysR family transcriptional regulator, partial [Cellvibrionales bacterium]|nr:LysR family transcriptional regulator [Cellvibrionales bacterium]